MEGELKTDSRVSFPAQIARDIPRRGLRFQRGWNLPLSVIWPRRLAADAVEISGMRRCCAAVAASRPRQHPLHSAVYRAPRDHRFFLAARMEFKSSETETATAELETIRLAWRIKDERAPVPNLQPSSRVGSSLNEARPHSLL